MASKPLVATLFSVALIAGCQSNSAKQVKENTTPQWITVTPTSSYMIYGVGNAQNTGDMQQAKLAAQESARLALAKQLNVTISANTTIKQQADNKSMTFHIDEYIQSKVPNIQLQGVKIEDEYISVDSKTAYALAAFNRTEAVMQTELSISAIDDEISHFQFARTQSKSLALKNAVALKQLGVKRDKYNNYLQMLQAAHVAIPSAVRAKLNAADALLNNVSFSISADSQKHQKVRDMLAQALSSQGIKVTDKNADFTLKFRVDWQDMKKAGTYYSLAESYLVITEQGEEKAHFNAKVKAASSFEDTAKSNAMGKLADKLGQQLAKFVVTGKS
ncbi:MULTISPECIES: LPP20 family lipoprotein [Pseudoalteromonas]|uniref:LPP20 family lipoprotein n=1 Tax=Pseudoalteromonas obscura TaxID=3048491 RepID=A0ABT7ESF7_9GAMM|nr:MULTISPECIES: LPP20 family lipoprotein [Pseudoalteromonas]MBQ4835394.1 LPP20 family lipoprotein [Pseudoalteromonas luteoviolacea]MDK2597962.1 LPP20 family lipoprotein [Pseudoalteromonas sp. P94(2023)]